MTGAERVMRALAATLPRHTRDRYLQEWTADVEGAEELGMPRAAIIRGAAMIALTIDRGDPRRTGVPRAALASRNARWAVAAGGSSATLAAGWVFGGRGSPTAEGMPASAVFTMLDAGLGALAVLFGAICVALTLAAVSALTGRTARGALLLGAVTLGFGSIALAAIAQPGLAVLSVPLVGIVLALAVAAAGAGRPGTFRLRALTALSLGGLALLVLATAIMHTLVWNPLARIPGMPLGRIYDEMISQGQLTADFGIVFGVWVAVAVGAIALFVTLTLIPGHVRMLPLRRVITLGCLLVGGVVFLQWFAGFSIGMALADTFVTSGGEAAWTGSLLRTLAELAFVAALLAGLTGPARTPGAEPAPAAAPTLP